MTDNDFTSIEQEVDKEPLFEQFIWHRKELEDAKVSGSTLANFGGQVRDIASGCATKLEMIEFDYLQDAGGEQKLMNNTAAGNLTRLAIQSLKLLNQQADDTLTWAYERSTKEGIASRTGKA